jgi:hypothetical protein
MLCRRLWGTGRFDFKNPAAGDRRMKILQGVCPGPLAEKNSCIPEFKRPNDDQKFMKTECIGRPEAR